ncbi:hypothetical protein SDC9_141671 [bioreactor metagenome]|uniref:Uncharacterized protein n=1 Tax=bioreactor metagenome TaxID=1076179 RepID=A0A645DYX2_9ZZZZ
MAARAASSRTYWSFRSSATVSSVRKSSSNASIASTTRPFNSIRLVCRRFRTMLPPKLKLLHTRTLIPAVNPTERLRSWLLRMPMHRLHSVELLLLIRMTPNIRCPSRASPYCSSRIVQSCALTTSVTASITSTCGTGFQLAVAAGVGISAISSRWTNFPSGIINPIFLPHFPVPAFTPVFVSAFRTGERSFARQEHTFLNRLLCRNRQKLKPSK